MRHVDIELRSLNGIQNVTNEIRAGDYDDVTELRICLHPDYFGSLERGMNTEIGLSSPEPLIRLMQVVGRLPSLTDVDLMPAPVDISNPLVHFPAAALNGLFGSAHGLEKFSMHLTRLIGAVQDFEHLATLWNFAPLKSLAISVCECMFLATGGQPPSTDAKFPLEDALCNLTTMKKVEELEIVCYQQNPIASSRVLKALCSLPMLRQFTHCCVANEDIKVIATAFCDKRIARNTVTPLGTLKSSQLPPPLAEAWSSGSSTKSLELEQLELQCHEVNCQGAAALRTLLGACPKLKSFSLTLWSGSVHSADADSIFDEIVQGIKESSCVSLCIHVRNEELLPIMQRKLRSMLRANYILESLVLNTWDVRGDEVLRRTVEDHEIEFLIKTNKLGRRFFFHSDSNDQNAPTWMSLLEATDGHLTNIYILLSSHPQEFADLLSDYIEREVPVPMRPVERLMRKQKRALQRGIDATMEALRQELIATMRPSVEQTKLMNKLVKQRIREASRTVDENHRETLGELQQVFE